MVGFLNPRAGLVIVHNALLIHNLELITGTIFIASIFLVEHILVLKIKPSGMGFEGLAQVRIRACHLEIL